MAADEGGLAAQCDALHELLDTIKFEVVQFTRGMGIELARGPYKAFPHMIAVRERGDPTLGGEAGNYDVDSFDDLSMFEDASLDFIFAWGEPARIVPAERVPLLDHVRRLLKQGGFFVVAPDADSIEVYEKSDDTFYMLDYLPPADQKTACVVRYGAIGDTLQAASVLPELKRQGYHVTFMCEPGGAFLLKNDPNIDSFMVQDKDQVPNILLPDYWAAMRKRFDRWINLCESVEGSLITLPGRANHGFPQSLRHEVCNKNYLEFMAKMAELPFHPEHHFYPTDAERKFASDFIAKIEKAVNPDFVIGMKNWQKPFTVLWALSGSSVHKTYPHQDAVIARILLEIPYAHVILTGDVVCKILEAGWEEEPRVHCLAGEAELRDVLALAQQVDLVVGPETGTLNAVAFETNAKIVLLSHSTHENLTRDWVNTESIATETTPCYPCHRMHYDRTWCPEHKESGTAMCQWEITPDRVWAAVQRAVVGRATVNRLLST